MKKILVLLISVVLLFSVGCNNQETHTSSVSEANQEIESSSNIDETNDTAQIYIDMAQEYLDDSNYDAAIKVLEKGFDSTGSAEIAEMLKTALEHQRSDSKDDASSTIEFDEESEANNSKKTPNENFIINDLKKNSINGFQLNYCYEILNVDSLEIIKRKTEDDFDTVYVSVVFKNTDYTVNADITLYYGFYTVGGWILDYHEITNHKSYANMPYYTNDTFVQLLLENFDEGEIVSRDHGVNGSGNFYDNISFSGSLKYNYLTTNITGTYSMFFDNDVWYSEVVFDTINHDWSQLCGTWKYTHDNGDYIVFEMKNISGINEEKCNISYSYSTSSWKWLDVLYGTNMTDYTETSTGERIFMTEKTYLFGLEVVIPKYLALSVNLGGDISLGYSVLMDRNDGGVLKAAEILYKGPNTSNVHEFALIKN